MSRQIYFGGSFNPPHRAHSEMIGEALRHDSRAVLHLVPTKNNPLKDSPGSNVDLIQAWLEDLAHKLIPEDFTRIQLETIEMLSDKSPSYTVETLAELHEGRDWTLLLGSDSALDFLRWRDPRKILSMINNVWIVPRLNPGERLNEKNLRELLQNFRADIQIEFLNPVSAISSTQLRAETSSHTLEEFLSPRVYAVWKRFL